jgi:branched-subunit amino acid aminotransferase/4-amino-4-deoxychorismate lyase
MKAQADPDTIVYFKNQYLKLRDAQVSILTHALHYGTGVFEGSGKKRIRRSDGELRSCRRCARTR